MVHKGGRPIKGPETPSYFALTPEHQAAVNEALGATSKKQPPLTRSAIGEFSHEPVKKSMGAIQNSGIELDPANREVSVPVMTLAETDNNEPSYGHRMQRVRVPQGVSPETFRLILGNAYAEYMLHGKFTTESVAERSGVAKGRVSRVLASLEFKKALELRGVENHGSGLTVEQDFAVQILSDPADNRTLSQKLKAIGVSNTVYRTWLKQPLFRDLMESLSADLLANNSDSLVVLERLAGNGDLNAIKYKHLLNGTYDPNKQTNVDIMGIMTTVFEIVAAHVKDASTLEAIASELGQAARGIAPVRKQKLLEG